MSECKGNTYNIGMGCCVPRIVNPDLYYTKEEVDEKIDGVELSGITESKAQEMIDESLQDYNAFDVERTEELINESLASYYTKAQTDNKLDAINDKVETLSGEGATKEYVSGYTYDKTTIENMIEEGGGFLPENYYTKAATDELLSRKANTATTYTKTNVNTLLTKKADTATTYSKDEVDALLTPYFDSVQYNSSTKRINFYNNNVIKGYVDATDFVKDGMVDSVAIENNNLVITFNTDSGKQPISIPLTSVFNPNDYYTKTEVDNALNNKTNTTAFTAHTSDANIHITSQERTAWNNKSNFSGSYNDLADKPTIPSYWIGTKSQYDAISTKDNNTIYYIKED